MSSQLAQEHVCYVNCNFCNTVLAVGVPGSNAFSIVTVRCGHCANLLAVNMGAMLQSLPLPDLLNYHNLGARNNRMEIDYGSSSKLNWASVMNSMETTQQQTPLPIRPPMKRQRVPSAYNRFIKEEIKRIKATNPNISHREAFSAAAKNWAHLPRIHFGMSTLEGDKKQVDQA